MKVHVVFEFPEISDADGEDASFVIDILTQELEGFAVDSGYDDWYIDDVTGDPQ